jgi:hypothetical protein
MACLAALLKDHKHELEELLVGDKQVWVCAGWLCACV